MNVRCFYIIVSILFVPSALGIVVGSNSVPSRQALVTFPASDSDNEMRGFGAFENGFTLEDNTTSCLFTSFFPSSGVINLNGGTLNINTDMVLDSAADVQSAGTMNGNNCSLVLPDKIGAFDFPSTTFTWNLVLSNVRLFLNSDVVFNVPVTIEGTTEIHGNGYTLHLSHADGVTIAAGASLKMVDITVANVSGSKLDGSDGTSALTLQDTTLVQENDTQFTAGSVVCSGNVRIRGPYIFSYQSDQACTIASKTQLMIDRGATFKYDPSISSALLFVMTDNTSTLFLNSATLHASIDGLRLTKGTLLVDGRSYLASDATLISQAIELGDGTSQNDITVELLPGANLEVAAGFVKNSNTT